MIGLTNLRNTMLVAVVLGTSILSCSNDSTTLEPLPQSSYGIVIGTVLADGRGVPDATVRLESIIEGLPLSIYLQKSTGGDIGAIVSVSPRVTLTDEEGKFLFAGVEADHYLVTSRAANHLGGSAEFTVHPALAAAGTTFVDIALVPTGQFTGNVALQNESDHSGSIVYVLGSSNVAVTDSAGDYVLTNVPVGTHSVQASHPGWLEQNTSGTVSFAGDSTALASLVLPRENNIAPIAIIDPLTTFPVLNSVDVISFVTSSTDPDGSIVLYEWDYEDDGVFDSTFAGVGGANIDLIVSAGTHRTKLRVTDDKGAIGLDVVTYTVYDPIYVSSVTGGDASTGGPSDPFASIQDGINAAAAQGLPVLVDNLGSYAEAPEFNSYVDVRGGHDGSWNPTLTKSLILIDSFSSARANTVAFADISGFRFERDHAQGSGQTAIALTLIGCSSTLRFVDCEIVAGNGTAALTTGAAGTPGITATPGSAGDTGCLSGVGVCTIACPIDGGPGGSGAAFGRQGGSGGCMSGASPSFEGGDGFSGGGPAGGAGGLGGGNSCGPTSNGQNGGPGTSGSDGLNGAAVAVSFGTIVGESWSGPTGLQGGAGADGTGGSGGGGGGSAGSTCGYYAGAGGGGGGAGGLGTGGQGGLNGGASIAVLVIGGSPTFDTCTIESGNGGNGWRGGAGGALGIGGPPGAGGLGYSSAGNGGNGGVGGSGGGGGGGSGGPGAPSVGVYQYQVAAMTLINITWTIGTGGTGGPGGMNGNGVTQAVAGPNGPTAQTYLHP